MPRAWAVWTKSASPSSVRLLLFRLIGLARHGTATLRRRSVRVLGKSHARMIPQPCPACVLVKTPECPVTGERSSPDALGFRAAPRVGVHLAPQLPLFVALLPGIPYSGH